MNECWVYMVRCSDGSLYCGVAAGLDRRVERHNQGRGGKYTRSRLPVRLVWSQRCEGRGLAMKVEAWIKELSKEDKEALCLRKGLSFSIEVDIRRK